MRPATTAHSTIVFAGGGTGGHLYPALAIAEMVKIQSHDSAIVFIGTAGKIEARVVPSAGYQFETIWISGFRRTLSWSLLLFPLKVCVSLVQSLVLLRRLRPSVVVGTGGYVCGPPVFMASMLGIPTVLQEQNSYPGVTTRLLAAKADHVFISFENTRRYLPGQAHITLAGNPVRAAVGNVGRDESATFFGINPALKTILVFGGSLGATSINTAMKDHLQEIMQESVQLLWQTGKNDLGMAQRAVDSLTRAAQERIKVLPFIDRMDMALGACDFAICRSGASTLAELALAGVPAILIPYPHAAADHQTENARAVVACGAAELCPDHEAGSKLVAFVNGFLHDETHRRQMSRQMRTLARPDAARRIADTVISFSRHANA